MKKFLLITALVAFVCSVNGQINVADAYIFPDSSGLTSTTVTGFINLAPDCFDKDASDPFEDGLFDGDYTNEVGTETGYYFNEPTYVTTIKVYIGSHWNGSGSDAEEPSYVSYRVSGGTSTGQYYYEEGVYMLTVNAVLSDIYLQFGDLYFNEIEVFGQLDLITTTVYEGDLSFNGKVGVGTTSPSKELDVNGDINFTGNLYKKGSLVSLDAVTSSSIWTDSGSNIYYDGNVGIGTTNATSELTVDGKIECEEIEVKDVGADYVFEADYILHSLEEVENFINENGHLPDVAPASETVKGVELAKFNTLLLQKIEELTLYIIEQDKRIAKLEEVE